MRQQSLIRRFWKSESAGGFVLLAGTACSLVLANTVGAGYEGVWSMRLHLSAALHLDHDLLTWINEGLMSFFFLLAGLEIRRELTDGELASRKQALLPVLAAVGGMLCPALIHYALNAGLATQSGFGIPMATDIAFALGILSLAGRRVPFALRVFLTALAIIDDLGAIIVIAVFYTQGFVAGYVLGALAVLLLLIWMGREGRSHPLPYALGGLLIWYGLLRGGIQPSIAGVLLAFALPGRGARSLAYRVQERLHRPVAFFVLPLFVLANTAIVFPADTASLVTRNTVGIAVGLVVGKLAGIFLFSYIAVRTGVARLPAGLGWRHVLGMALLGGIGFTMSIFITNLAFTDQPTITAAKISILTASGAAAVLGLGILITARKRV